MPDNNIVLASDIGGTHITSALVDTDDRKILDKTITRHKLNSSEDAKSIFRSWSSNMLECLEKSNHTIDTIGIAMPGPFDYENGISLMKGQDKYDQIYQFEVGTPLKSLIGSNIKEIRYINDAAAFLQGEVFAQNLDKEEGVLGITLGTGLGSSVYMTRNSAIDANLWNAPYKESFFEEYLVTRWFTKRFKELTGVSETGLKEILQKHSDKNETNILIAEYAESLYDFMKFFSERFKYKPFVIGGNIANVLNKFVEKKPELSRDFTIIPSKHQEFAAIIGAASLYHFEAKSY